MERQMHVHKLWWLIGERGGATTLLLGEWLSVTEKLLAEGGLWEIQLTSARKENMKYRLQNTKYRIQLNRSEWFAVTAKLLAEREMLSCIWHWKMHLPQMTERRIHHISLAIKPKVVVKKQGLWEERGLGWRKRDSFGLCIFPFNNVLLALSACI